VRQCCLGVEEGKTLSIYVHIPICAHKCYYCDFYSRPVDSQARVDYLKAVCAEIENSRWIGSPARSLYIGGGTPSLLTGDEIAHLVALLEEAFAFQPDAEWTVECNPGTVSPACCDRLVELGFDRISLGVQSFSESQLRRLGRLHSAQQSLCSFRWFREAGCENINLDLIFGLPDQTLEEWRRDLEQALELAPEHLSLYGLTIEAGTPFGHLQQIGALRQPPEELTAAMYELCMDLSTAAGYEQYEISNYAFPGFECRHNLVYWRNEPYLGFGISAASYIDGVRWTNTLDWDSYLRRAPQGDVPRSSEERLPPNLAMAEEMMLRLRTREGVSPKELSQKYGIRFESCFGESLMFLRKEGLISLRNGRLTLTRRGKLLADEVCSEFLHAAREQVPLD